MKRLLLIFSSCVLFSGCQLGGPWYWHDTRDFSPYAEMRSSGEPESIRYEQPVSTVSERFADSDSGTLTIDVLRY